jgi:hypothetical protein
MKFTDKQIALAHVQQARAKMLDELDYPGTWTKRQRNVEDTRKAQFDGLIQSLRLAPVPGTTDALRQHLDYVLGLKKTLEDQLAEVMRAAEDYRGLDQGRMALARCDTIKASLLTLQRGGVSQEGDRIDGIPNPLRVLLTTVCAACGHARTDWPGTIPAAEAALAEAERTIPHQRAQLDMLLQRAEHWLAADAERTKTVTV